MARVKKSTTRYRRILLKLSGEAFQSRENCLSIDPDVVAGIARKIHQVARLKIQIAVVIGGGNIFRGALGERSGMDRSSGDYMGMLGTIINALALQNALEKIGLHTRVLTAIEMQKVAEPFILRRALRHFDKGRILIFAGGTGNPYFSTDTAAALRASEIGADVLLKGTKVDGIYSADPMKHRNATRYGSITYREALNRSLKVMDATAFALCMENNIPIVVFNFFQKDSLYRAVTGKEIGTLVHK